ncbi:MAG: cell wall-binding repeat-containing protein, partial [Ruminococcus sp.]|nr:cell wall-binding repeat-containing protein [Ruminococcus sp.]
PLISINAHAEQSEQFDPEILKDNDIPALYITIDENAEGYGTIKEMNESPDHSVMCTGTVRLDVPDGYTGDYSSEALDGTGELKLDYIRGRGHSTWGTDKKPYKLKLSKSTDLLGMGKNKHWVLLANSGDDSLLKNRLTSYIGTQLGLEFTPQMLPVDVVMNGDYLGNYYLSEQVRVGASRVAIDELTPDDNEEPDVSGGYLLALGRKNDAEGEPASKHIVTRGGNVFYSESPEFYEQAADGAGTDAQYEYISGFMQKIENAVLSDDFTDESGIALDEYLDFDSAASYWWVNNFLKNTDAFATTSTYLYKKRDGKLYYGPLWDFDQSMTGASAEGFNKGNTLWLNRLRSFNPEYQQILLEKWDKLDSIITDIVKQGGVLDKYAAELYPSEQDNEKRWKIKETYSEHDIEFDYNKWIEDLRSWLAERQQWVRDNIDEKLFLARVRVTFMDDGKVLGVSEQNYMEPAASVPAPPLKDGYVFDKWLTADGEPFDVGLEMTENATVYASYIPESEAVMADDIFLSSYDVWFDISCGTDTYTPEVMTVPENAQEKVYEWSSSEPSVADVDANGKLTVHSAGETVVTVRLRNGKEKKMTFHVYDPGLTPTRTATALSCESNTITVRVGDYAQINVSASPTPNDDDYFFYNTQQQQVIELLDYGLFRALTVGEADVTITDLDGLQTKCKVIVTEKEHSFSEWKTTAFDLKENTSTQTRTCSVCNKTETKTTDNAVQRLCGDNRFITASEISEAGFENADTVILASGFNYADAMAGVPLAAKLDAPMLLTAKDTLPDATLAEIQRLGAKKVIILGGTGAISTAVENSLKKEGLETERLAGSTRFGTAAAIAERLSDAPSNVFFVYYNGFADTLSVSTAAAIKNAPLIYLTTDGELSADTAAYLAKLKAKGCVKNAYVIGGDGVISDDMMNKAAKALGLEKASRIAGKDRFATCTAVNKAFADVLDGDMLCVATGMDFPDALAGGVYAAINKAPLFLINGKLTSPSLTDEQKAYLKSKNAKSITVFGGSGVVADGYISLITESSV